MPAFPPLFPRTLALAAALLLAPPPAAADDAQVARWRALAAEAADDAERAALAAGLRSLAASAGADERAAAGEASRLADALGPALTAATASPPGRISAFIPWGVFDPIDGDPAEGAAPGRALLLDGGAFGVADLAPALEAGVVPRLAMPVVIGARGRLSLGGEAPLRLDFRAGSGFVVGGVLALDGVVLEGGGGALLSVHPGGALVARRLEARAREGVAIEARATALPGDPFGETAPPPRLDVGNARFAGFSTAIDADGAGAVSVVDAVFEGVSLSALALRRGRGPIALERLEVRGAGGPAGILVEAPEAGNAADLREIVIEGARANGLILRGRGAPVRVRGGRIERSGREGLRAAAGVCVEAEGMVLAGNDRSGLTIATGAGGRLRGLVFERNRTGLSASGAARIVMEGLRFRHQAPALLGGDIAGEAGRLLAATGPVDLAGRGDACAPTPPPRPDPQAAAPPREVDPLGDAPTPLARDRAIAGIEAAVAAGDRAATFALARLHLSGPGLGLSRAKGVALLERLAAAGSGAAMTLLAATLGEAAEEGARARLLLVRALDAGHAGAAFPLARRLEAAREVEAARTALRRGLAGGDVPAALRLLSTGTGPEAAAALDAIDGATRVDPRRRLALGEALAAMTDAELARAGETMITGLAEAGDPAARLAAARRLRRENAAAAHRLAALAAGDGFAPAALWLAEEAIAAGATASAAAWRDRAVALAPAEAADALVLVRLLVDPRLGAPDRDGAETILRRLAAAGDPSAMAALARHLAPPGEEAAALRAEVASAMSLHDREARRLAARLAVLGLGGPVDLAAALAHLEAATALGSRGAAAERDRLIRTGLVPRP
jgi:hypothetical protein